MKPIVKLTSILLIVFVLPLMGQKASVKGEPGYVEFGDMTRLEAGDMVAEVLLEDHLLRMVAKFTQDEPELSSLLKEIKLIKVNVVSVTAENETQVLAKINDIEENLNNKNWDRIVRVKDRGETANVFIKTEGEEDIIGLLVMAFDKEGEAAFVNIVGNINLETIGKLGEKFGIDPLEDLSGEIKSSH